MKLSLQKVIVLLFVVLLPLFVFGKTVLQGQVYGLILFSLLGASLLLPNIWLRWIGLIVSAWLGCYYVLIFIKPIPLTYYINVSMMIFFGMAILLFVVLSTLPLDLYFGAICVSALIQAIIGICQKMGFDPISVLLSKLVPVGGEMDFSTPVGTLANPNYLGAYLAISIPFFFRKRWAWLIPIIAFALYLTNARAACGAAIIGIGFFFWGWKGSLAAIIPGLAYITLISHSLTQLLNSDRYLFWIDAIEKICLSAPSFLVGYGQGAVWKSNEALHSEYIGTMFHLGTIGLFCMLAYIVSVFRSVRGGDLPRRGFDKAGKMLPTAFLILCVNMVANHPLHIAPTAVLAITVVGLIEREKRHVHFNSIQNQS